MRSTSRLAIAVSAVLLSGFVFVRPALGQKIIYVNVAAQGPQYDGTSWTTAYPHLQIALQNATTGDQIWVAGGTFTPTLDMNRGVSFQLRDGVAIYGGFPGQPGQEGDFEVRDPDFYVTTLSGDLAGNDGPDFGNNGDNSYHVVTASYGVGPGTVLDGVTVSGGNANGPPSDYDSGGGMYIASGYLTLTNCTFSGNSAAYGGGMYIARGDPTLTDCTFSGNSATYTGGGISCDESSPTLTDCTFKENRVFFKGGGMYYLGSPTLTDCTFSGNSADHGGGMYNSAGGPELTRCTFSGNSAAYGGGMENMYGPATLTHCTFSANSAAYGAGMDNESGNPTLTGCTFSDNSAAYGGGIDNYHGDPTLIDCTFSGNSASDYGGGMYNNSGDPTLTDCKFSGNSADFGGGMYASGNPTLTDCTFSGNSASWGGGGMWNNNGAPTLTGCTFSGNSADLGGGMNTVFGAPALTNCTFSGNSAAWGGGGMWNNNGAPTLTDCTFSANSVSRHGGGMFTVLGTPMLTNCTFSGNSASDYGGGMYDYTDGSTLTNCTFSSNSAAYGGGMYNYSAPAGGGPMPRYGHTTLANCTFGGNTADSGGGLINYGNPTLTNCTFSGNWVSVDGGGVCNVAGAATLTNCTFSGNSADYAGGLANYYIATLTNCTFSGNWVAPGGFGGGVHDEGAATILTNCIVWGNTAPGGSTTQISGSPTVTYSCVQDAWAGMGNISLDPRLLSNLRLRRGSPCIDAGDNNAVPEEITTDPAGNPRFVDDPDTLDTGNQGSPPRPVVDMGAYEYQPAAAKRLYVKSSASPGGNGVNWGNAYKYLQDALAAAQLDPYVTEIWVAAGTYQPDRDSAHPSGTRVRSRSFQPITGMAVRGGFVGDELPSYNPADRDFAAHTSILSGDLAGNDGPNFTNNAENSYHVVTTSLVGPEAVLDGFTVSGGNANGSSSNSSGGGVYDPDSSPRLINCTLSSPPQKWA